MAEQWMSIVEYARTFSISDMTVRRRIKNGKLSAVLRDGKYYIQVGNQAGASSHLPPSFNEEPAAPSYTAPKLAASTPPAHVIEKGGAVSKSHHWADDSTDYVNIPRSISQTLTNQSSLADLRALLDFCDRSISRINSIERHLGDSYQNKFTRLEAELKHKDHIIAQLNQKVEDLQILIKMYDSKGHQ